MWLRSETNHAEAERAELRRQWAEFYRLLENNHRQLARESAERARALEEA